MSDEAMDKEDFESLITGLNDVRDWEQGRRQPERAARILLAMIENEPETVKRVLGRI
jgi:DNA-binding transcriptional regulator YiaG